MFVCRKCVPGRKRVQEELTVIYVSGGKFLEVICVKLVRVLFIIALTEVGEIERRVSEKEFVMNVFVRRDKKLEKKLLFFYSYSHSLF